MLRYLIIMLDASAPSFCYYPDPPSGGDKMPLEVLRKAVFFAQTHAMGVNVLCAEPPAKEMLEELDKINHIIIGPPSITCDFVWNIPILNAGEDLSAFAGNPDKNVILRTSMASLPNLPEAVRTLKGKFRRLNVIITDEWKMTTAQVAHFQEILNDVGRYADGVQISLVTDRGMLDKPSHCDAGVRHLTVAPDGRFYVCPGFFLEDPDDSCGSVDEGVYIPLEELYRLDHAPICRVCDAWQCKRCVWMNRKRTLEVNTPSRGQCITSHVVRNHALKDNPTPYLDPFELIGR